MLKSCSKASGHTWYALRYGRQKSDRDGRMCVQPHTHMWSAITVDVRRSTATDIMTIMRCEDSSELLSKNYAMQRISNVGLTSGKSQGCSFVTLSLHL